VHFRIAQLAFLEVSPLSGLEVEPLLPVVVLLAIRGHLASLKALAVIAPDHIAVDLHARSLLRFVGRRRHRHATNTGALGHVTVRVPPALNPQALGVTMHRHPHTGRRVRAHHEVIGSLAVRAEIIARANGGAALGAVDNHEQQG